MTRIVKSLASLGILLLMLVAVPWALLELGRLDALAELRWRHLVTATDTGGLLLGLMTLVAWVGWLVLAASVVAEVLAVLSRGRISVRVPGGRWVQPLVSSLVVAVLGATAVTPGAARAAPPSPAVAAAAAPASVAPMPDAQPQDQDADPAAGHDDSQVHEVRSGDDLWSIAEHYYGDGSRWRRIAEENQLARPDVLPVGLCLTLPGLPSDAATAAVVVQPGDTLAGIARAELGNASRWPDLLRLNPDLVRDPDVIQPGWRLVLPRGQAGSADTGADGVGSGGQHVTPGDPAASGTTPDATVGHRPDDPSPGAAGDEDGPAGRQGADTAGAERSTNGLGAGQGHREPDDPGRGTRSTDPSRRAGEHEQVVGGARTALAAQQAADLAESPPAALQPGPAGPASPRGGAAATSPSSAHQTSQAQPAPGETAPGGDLDPTSQALPDDDPAQRQVVAMGALLAAALAGALALRRRHQLARRSLGRRISLPGPEALHLESVLARHAAVVPEAPDAAMTAVLLGHRSGEPVLHELERTGLTVVTGDYRESLVAAAATGLALHPWSAETRLVVAGSSAWMAALDEPQVQVLGLEQALTALERTLAARRIELNRARLAAPGAGLGELRADPDRWEAWAPEVIVLADELDAEQQIRLHRALDGAAVGVSVLAVGDGPAAGAAHVEAPSATLARLDGQDFEPWLLDPAARRALTDLVTTSSSDATTPAPWWGDDDHLPPNLAVLPPRTTRSDEQEAPVDPAQEVQHPTLLLLGPIELVGCRGDVPSRARKQCVEYCAWLQDHPGATATQMSRELLVAEGTRRSNMSRLRSWLGSDPAGEPYLPDAYTGRIQLHPGISTDWEHLQLLIGPGVNRCATSALVEALEMVRGAPLADAAPGQWHWAEAMRTDMCSAIRDIGVVIAARAVQDQDLDLGRWAVSRALAAAPGDELLLGARIRIEHLAGNRPEVERLVLQLTRQARNTGLDLSDETVVLLQEVMEGRRRALA